MYHNVGILVLFAIFGSAVCWPTLFKTKFRHPDADVSCLITANISMKELGKFKTLKMGPKYREKIACYSLCVALKEGSVNAESMLKFEVVTGSQWEVAETTMHQVYRICRAKQTVGDPCKTFYDTTACLRKEVNRAIDYEILLSSARVRRRL